MKTYWVSGGTAPPTRNFYTRWRLVVSFTAGTHWIRGRVGPKAVYIYTNDITGPYINSFHGPSVCISSYHEFSVWICICNWCAPPPCYPPVRSGN